MCFRDEENVDLLENEAVWWKDYMQKNSTIFTLGLILFS
jgi:hypothetical protein